MWKVEIEFTSGKKDILRTVVDIKVCDAENKIEFITEHDDGTTSGEDYVCTDVKSFTVTQEE